MKCAHGRVVRSTAYNYPAPVVRADVCLDCGEALGSDGEERVTNSRESLMKYELLNNDCQSCGMQVPLAEFPNRAVEGKTVLLCEVCSKTQISAMTVHYLRQYSELAPLAVVLAQCTNMILTEMRKKQGPVLEENKDEAGA